ncbi:MAG: family 43 glycosylhydrolase [Bifidobacteriaceae bacterium]|jgi:beta-xylosidase|nr:family 43 glycosylhydrolase [Bifidobacteriaceae bacterium]
MFNEVRPVVIGKSLSGTVERPFVPSTPLHGYCSDPNLVIFDGKYYLYCTDDGVEDWATAAFSVYVSTDLAQWERHPLLDLHDVPWWKGRGGGWAPSILHARNGTYVLYFVADSQIGAAVADSPLGPFIPQAEPLITVDDFDGVPIDPAVFTDDDDQDYLLWGNGRAHAAALEDDGFTFARESVISWAPGNFREALWIHKRHGVYYSSWSENDTRDHDYQVHYSTAAALTGPWSEPRVLVVQRPECGIYATGHHSILNIPGTDEWIIAYHRFALVGGDGAHRETVFAPLEYMDDNSLKQVVPQVGSYIRSLEF